MAINGWVILIIVQTICPSTDHMSCTAYVSNILLQLDLWNLKIDVKRNFFEIQSLTKWYLSTNNTFRSKTRRKFLFSYVNRYRDRYGIDFLIIFLIRHECRERENISSGSSRTFTVTQEGRKRNKSTRETWRVNVSPLSPGHWTFTFKLMLLGHTREP